MTKLLAAVVLCVPVVSNADLLFIKYEGAVSGFEEQTCPCPQSYSIGDPVSGKLTIDLALAERSTDATGTMGADYLPGRVNFISGRPLAAEGTLNDAVFFYNGMPAAAPAPANTTFDRVEVWDGVAGDTADMLGISVQRLSPYGQLIDGVGPVQEFDVTPDEGTTLTGQIIRALGGAVGAFKQRINVAFTHVSMGVCKRSS